MIYKPWHIVGQDATRIEADATAFVAAINQSIQVLLRLEQVEQQNITSFARMTQEGTQVTNTIRGLGVEGQRVAVTLKNVGDAFNVVRVASDRAGDKIEEQRRQLNAAAIAQKRFADEAKRASRAIAGGGFSVSGA